MISPKKYAHFIDGPYLSLLHYASRRLVVYIKRLIRAKIQLTQGVGGVMVSIVAFQAVDPSSILGHRRLF